MGLDVLGASLVEAEDVVAQSWCGRGCLWMTASASKSSAQDAGRRRVGLSACRVSSGDSIECLADAVVGAPGGTRRADAPQQVGIQRCWPH